MSPRGFAGGGRRFVVLQMASVAPALPQFPPAAEAGTVGGGSRCIPALPGKPGTSVFKPGAQNAEETEL